MHLEEAPHFPPRRWVIMGVSGCGKSEIGARFAAKLNLELIEGDAFHPPANIAKMAAGSPLNDVDRQGWLQVLRDRVHYARQAGTGLVLSCSALKRAYRDILREGDPDLTFVHLTGDHDVIANRMKARPGHFMPISLLESQFRDLEPLQADERSIVLNIDTSPESLVEQILDASRQVKSEGENV